ncbi:MAG TPA: cupin domain-containing protein [Chthoniobacterales bacterium]
MFWEAGTPELAATETESNQTRSESANQRRPMSAQKECNLPATHPEALVAVRPTAEVMTRQHLPYFLGISKATAGAKGISMNLVIIPPGGAASPHFHRGFETAIYLISGRVKTRYGSGLKHSIINQTGDFLYIPADLPHQPINLSKTEPALAIVCRNDANEQESVVHYGAEAET